MATAILTEVYQDRRGATGAFDDYTPKPEFSAKGAFIVAEIGEKSKLTLPSWVTGDNEQLSFYGVAAVTHSSCLFQVLQELSLHSTPFSTVIN